MLQGMKTVGAAVVAGAIALGAGVADAADRTVEIAGFGAKSGVVRSFGINTDAVMRAAAEAMNDAGVKAEFPVDSDFMPEPEQFALLLFHSNQETSPDYPPVPFPFPMPPMFAELCPPVNESEICRRCFTSYPPKSPWEQKLCQLIVTLEENEIREEVPHSLH